MISHLQVKIAVGTILQRKREKNRALANDQKQPRFPLIAMFAEIQKELEKPGTAVPPSHLDTVLLEIGAVARTGSNDERVHVVECCEGGVEKSN